MRTSEVPVTGGVGPSSETGATANKQVGSAHHGAGDDASTAAQLIDAKLAALGNWRGAMLAAIRNFIRPSDPEVVEEVKGREPSNPSGVSVWSHDGILCTSEVYKDKIELTFA